jgi:hypothetical protein
MYSVRKSTSFNQSMSSVNQMFNLNFQKKLRNKIRLKYILVQLDTFISIDRTFDRRSIVGTIDAYKLISISITNSIVRHVLFRSV